MNKWITNMSDIPKRDFVIGGISAILLLILFLYLLALENGISQRPAYTKGIIISKDIRLKGQPFINYNFTVENITYRGSTRYSDNLQVINIGDTCYVIYEQGTPDNNRLQKAEKDKRCFKIKAPYKPIIIFD